MAERRPRFLARWADLPLRTHLLAAGFAAVVILSFSLRKGPRDRPQPVASPSPSAPSIAFPTRLSPDRLTDAEASREAAPIAPEYRRDILRPPIVQNAAAEPSPSEDGPRFPDGKTAASRTARRQDEVKALPELFRMPPDPRTDASVPLRQDDSNRRPKPAERNAIGGTGGPFAPFGRLVKCTLVNSLDSATARPEPIVALVVRDLDWNGEVIIPAGTEVFSYARPEAILDEKDTGRLVDSGEWILVFPESEGRANGRELAIKGRALDRRESVLGDDGRPRSWGIDDGTDGLVGRAISTLDDREIKLFAAAAVSGIAQGFAALAERQQAAAGLAGALGATQPAATAGNAAIGSLGQGTSGAMNEFASRIRQEISRRGVYVRVPAGKEFYLFIEQTIDPGRAVVGFRLPPH